MEDLDGTDRAILYILQTDARAVTNTEIGERVGVSATTVGDRIAKMKQRGIIKTCLTDIDYERAGIPHYLLLFCTVPTARREELAREAIQTRGVVAAREVLAGSRNLHVEVVGRTNDEVAETIETLDDVGLDVRDVEIIKDEHHRPFDGFGHPDVDD